MANTEDSDEMPRNAAFHQSLHCLLRQNRSSEIEIHVQYFFEIISCDPSVCIIDHRAISPYHQGPIIGPISNPKYPSFFQVSPQKSQSETKKNLFGKRKLQNFSEPRCKFDLDSILAPSDVFIMRYLQGHRFQMSHNSKYYSKIKIRKTDSKGCKSIASFCTSPSAVTGGGDNNDPQTVSIDSRPTLSCETKSTCLSPCRSSNTSSETIAAV